MNEKNEKGFDLTLPQASEAQPSAPAAGNASSESQEASAKGRDGSYVVRHAARRIVPSPRLIDQRPWGKFEQFALNEPCSVKIITVNPGEQLSLQSHKLRKELWVILDEAMQVELDGNRFTVYQGEEVFIPLGTKHRAIGLEKPCRWLEIAYGTFDENDITRYEDRYGRS